MHDVNQLDGVVIQLAHQSANQHEAAGTIRRTLGFGMRSFGSEPDTLPRLIEKRLNDGDWLFSVDAKAFLGDRIGMISAHLRSLLSSPRVPEACHYRKVDGVREVGVPITVWGRGKFDTTNNNLIQTGLMINLVLMHGEDERLELTRIDVDARAIVESTFDRNPDIANI